MSKKKNPYSSFVLKTLKEYLKNKPPPKTFHPLDLIFKKERYTHSIMQGLVTSLGTTLWEPVAKLIAKEKGFEVLNTNEFNENAPVIDDNIRTIINNFHDSRLEKKEKLDVLKKKIEDELKDRDLSNHERKKIKKGDGLDVWLKKDDTEYMFEIKTVQINAGSGKDFSLKLCNLIAYRLLRGDPPTNLKVAVVFPYNPHKQDFYSKEKGKFSPMIAKEDALAADDFWDILTEETNSTQKILDAFIEVGKSGELKKFKNKFLPS